MQSLSHVSCNGPLPVVQLSLIGLLSIDENVDASEFQVPLEGGHVEGLADHLEQPRVRKDMLVHQAIDALRSPDGLPQSQGVNSEGLSWSHNDEEAHKGEGGVEPLRQMQVVVPPSRDVGYGLVEGFRVIHQMKLPLL